MEGMGESGRQLAANFELWKAIRQTDRRVRQRYVGQCCGKGCRAGGGGQKYRSKTDQS